MKRYWFIRLCIFLAGLIFLCFSSKVVCAMEEEQEDLLSNYYDNFYEGVELDHLQEELEAINRHHGRQIHISFEEVFGMLLEGDVDLAVKTLVTQFFENITLEIEENSKLIMKLVLLVVIAAIFNTYSSIYNVSFVGEQGFYVTYLMIAILLLQSFELVYEIAFDTIGYLKEIMECMLPALYASLMLCSGLTTTHMVNTMFVWMLSLLEKLLLFVVLPGIRIYFLVVLLNQVSSIDRFSKLASLLKQGLQFLLKAVVTGIIGLNVVKSLLVPVYDNAKYNLLQKGLSVMPGGSSLTGLSTILMGAGVLIKNSVGITVVVVFLVLGSIPLLEIVCFYIIYKVILAVVQPISNARILAGIQGAADSTGILLRATSTSMVLSVLSVAIIIMTTNVRLYVG